MHCMSRSAVASTRDTKILTGFGGAGIVEVVKDYRGDAFRVVYTVRLAEAVYVRLPKEIEKRAGNTALGH
jgi:phage-related protein